MRTLQDSLSAAFALVGLTALTAIAGCVGDATKATNDVEPEPSTATFADGGSCNGQACQMACVRDSECANGQRCVMSQRGEFASGTCVDVAEPKLDAASPDAASSSDAVRDAAAVQSDVSDAGGDRQVNGASVVVPGCDAPKVIVTVRQTRNECGVLEGGGTATLNFSQTVTGVELGTTVVGVAGTLTGSGRNYTLTFDAVDTVADVYVVPTSGSQSIQAVCGSTLVEPVTVRVAPRGACEVLDVLYVSSNGDDTRSGVSPSTAMRTLAAALRASSPATEIRIAEGSHIASSASVTQCRRLVGGYDVDFAGRDPKAHVTILEGTLSVASGGAVDGFTVNALDSRSALSLSSGADIGHNVLHGAAAGIEMTQAKCGSVHDNQVDATMALRIVQSKNVSFARNVLVGKSNFIQSSFVFEDNEVTGAPLSMAIWQNTGAILRSNVFHGRINAWQDSRHTFEANRFEGGIDAWQNTFPAYVDNMFLATKADEASAFEETSENVRFVGNTAVAGEGRVAASTGYSSESVTNNLIIGLGSGARVSFRSGSIENNVFVNIVDTREITTPVVADGLRRASNVSLQATPESLFVNYAGADGRVETLMDADWHLVSSARVATEGGKDAMASTCGVAGDLPCGGREVDILGNTRSAPFAVGAFGR